MEQTIILARLFALLYISVGLGMLLSRKRYQEVLQNLRDNPGFMYVAGVFTLIFGFVCVSIHNIWTGGWPVLITVLCWLSAIKGVVFLVFPCGMIKVLDYVIGKPRFLLFEGIFAILFGILLGYLACSV